MAWSNKSKNAVATSKQETKILQQSLDCEIRTPDGYQILLGSTEDLILIWRAAFNNWSFKVKVES